MNHYRRVGFVLLLVSSIVIVQNDALFAQSNASSFRVENYLSNTPAKSSTATLIAASLPFALPAPAASAPASTANAPQNSGSSKKSLGLVAGLALTATGAVLAARKEPVHQTTCIAYDSCPVPGLVRISGGLMLGVGVPLTILTLKHR